MRFNFRAKLTNTKPLKIKQNLCREYLFNLLRNCLISKLIHTKLRHQIDEICPPEIEHIEKIVSIFL